VLDGNGFAAIPDSDGGALDGDPHWDRAVGPMQFIPATWARWARDGDNDGVADPQDVEDATAASAAYLCAGGRDLATADGLRDAVLSYNHSIAYLMLVLRWKQVFDELPPGTVAVHVVATASHPTDAGSTAPTAPTASTAVPPSAAVLASTTTSTAPVPTPAAAEPAPPAAEPSVCPSPDPTVEPTTGPTAEPTTGPTTAASLPADAPSGEPTCVVPDATPTPTP
jgi:hypothetical protein